MIAEVFNTLLVEPFYNGLIFLISVVPFADVGLAIITLTIIVRLIFLPVFSRSIRTQFVMSKLQPQVAKINEQFKKDPQQKAKKTMELFRKYKVSPFGSLLTLFIQIPVFLALYFVFIREGLPAVNMELLYAFVPVPAEVNTMFLGFFDLTQTRDIVLAGLVGATQFVQVKLSPLGAKQPPKENPSMKDDIMRSQRLSFTYMMPLMIAGVSYFLPAAASVYWTASNTIGIVQELFIRRRIERRLKGDPQFAHDSHGSYETGGNKEPHN